MPNETIMLPQNGIGLLTPRGDVITVYAADYRALEPHNWHSSPKPNGYTKFKAASKAGVIWLHRFLMDAPDSVMVDHRDRDTRNNRRANLRFCTNRQNSANQGIRRTNSSGFKGVSPVGHKFRAYGRVDRKQFNLGLFEDPVAAALVRDDWARRTHGEFASLNFPRSGEGDAGATFYNGERP